MPSRRGSRRVNSGTAGPLQLAGMLVLCIAGGLILVGIAGLVLPLSLPTFVVAGLVVGLVTWLPLTVGTRALPGGRDTNDSP